MAFERVRLLPRPSLKNYIYIPRKNVISSPRYHRIKVYDLRVRGSHRTSRPTSFNVHLRSCGRHHRGLRAIVGVRLTTNRENNVIDGRTPLYNRLYVEQRRFRLYNEIDIHVD